jgi:hypothetical protein
MSYCEMNKNISILRLPRHADGFDIDFGCTPSLIEMSKLMFVSSNFPIDQQCSLNSPLKSSLYGATIDIKSRPRIEYSFQEPSWNNVEVHGTKQPRIHNGSDLDVLQIAASTTRVRAFKDTWSNESSQAAK